MVIDATKQRYNTHQTVIFALHLLNSDSYLHTRDISDMPMRARIHCNSFSSHEVTLSASYELDLTVKAGVQYTSADGWQAISERSLTQSYDWSYSVAAELTATVWVMPSFLAKIDLIGGPTVGVVGALILDDTFEYSASADDGTTCSNTFSIKLQEQITLGATISISLFGIDFVSETWGPLTLADWTQTLYSAELDCTTSSSSATRALLALEPPPRYLLRDAIPDDYVGVAFTTAAEVDAFNTSACSGLVYQVLLCILAPSAPDACRMCLSRPGPHGCPRSLQLSDTRRCFRCPPFSPSDAGYPVL